MAQFLHILKRIPIIDEMLRYTSPKAVLRRIAATAVVFAIGFTINSISATIIGRRFEFGKPVLPDLGHMYLPNINNPALPDLYFLIWVIYSFVRLIIFNKKGMAIMIRTFIAIGLELGMRGIVLNATMLPDPNPACSTYRPHIQTYGPFDLSCGDMMFSGHTAIWSIICCDWLMYAPFILDKIIGVLGLLGGAFVLLAAKAHYSADVLVGFYVGSSIWCIYHLLMRLPEPPRPIRWMEAPLNDIDMTRVPSIESFDHQLLAEGSESESISDSETVMVDIKKESDG
eukprot:TRINITY_DN9498_c0_g1_i1.p1 TRINITY_DN9498_c0_g1~~TRINITY_DN9498_c0_g1_i1.p1  ORF type:complete len:285 (-),score=23.68 TRINITY_DN9498_c0_g1_i1:14-868(-)